MKKKLCNFWNFFIVGRQCNECKDGYYNLNQDCFPCKCNKVGRMSEICDKGDKGLCTCRGNFTDQNNIRCVSKLWDFSVLIPEKLKSSLISYIPMFKFKPSWLSHWKPIIIYNYEWMACVPKVRPQLTVSTKILFDEITEGCFIHEWIDYLCLVRPKKFMY